MKAENIYRLIFPKRCPACDGLTKSDFPLCDSCKELLIRPSENSSRCPTCFMEKKSCMCAKHSFYDRLCIPLIYKDGAKHTIHKFKFRARPDLADSYTELLFFALNERKMLDDVDYITFVPMTRHSRFRRGYNQSELIAKKLSKKCSKPCVSFLTKCSTTSSQHSLKGLSRSGNLLGIFEPDKKYIGLVEDKTVLVIDDVSTTGSTFNEIAKTLLIFGAQSVYAAACTATQKKQKNIEQNKNL